MASFCGVFSIISKKAIRVDGNQANVGRPLYYEAVKGYRPIIAGVALFPATFTVAPMAIVTGQAITRTNSYRWTIYLGWAIATLGMGLTILLDVKTTIVQFVFINLVPGIGLGILFPALQFQLQAASSNKDMAFAVAMFTFFRSFGQAVGVAIGGVIFQNQMVKKLQAYPHYASQASALAKDAAALVEIIKKTPEGQDKLDIQTAYTDSIRTVYIVLTALAGVALITCFWIKAYDINIALETEQGLREEKKGSQRSLEEGGKEEVKA
jgi:MFS family permease